MKSINFFTTLIVFTLLLFSGCAGEYIVGLEDEPSPLAPNELDNVIIPGTTKRQEVRKIFNTPVTSDDSWRVEIYQINTSDSVGVYTWVFLPVLVVPTWYESIETKSYLLVTYDENWTVLEFDTGYYEEGFHQRSSTYSDNAQAGGFLLSIGTPIEFHPSYVYLFAPYEATESVISAPAEIQHCKLFIAKSGVSIQILLDGERILDDRGYGANNGFIVLPLASGTHQVIVLPGIAPLWQLDYKGELTKDLTCTDGRNIYLEIDSDFLYPESTWKRKTLVGEIRILDKPSEMFFKRRLILYHNEKWIGVKNPKRINGVMED